MHASVRAGGMAGAFFATSVGAQRPLGVEGWRFAFFTVAGISVFSGIVTLAFASDPRKVCFSPFYWSPAGPGYTCQLSQQPETYASQPETYASQTLKIKMYACVTASGCRPAKLV